MKKLLITIACLAAISTGCGNGDENGNDIETADVMDAVATDTEDTVSEHGGCLPGPDTNETPDVKTDTGNDDSNGTDADARNTDTTEDIADVSEINDGAETDESPADAVTDAADAVQPDTDTQQNDVVPDNGDDTGTPLTCPPDMALVNSVCMDKYEASRPDATSTSIGSDESMATSRAGVMPWLVSSMSPAALAVFEKACSDAGKRICKPDEFYSACAGPDENIYVWGNSWDRETCNNVDSFCDDYCEANEIAPESCSLTGNCGYTYNCFHVVPTGEFTNCVNDYGMYDVCGNVWEIVPSETDPRGYEVRGGAFNCAGASARLQCTFNATWDSLYAGFRCCKDPE